MKTVPLLKKEEVCVSNEKPNLLSYKIWETCTRLAHREIN
jgi:hypothetical protein